MRVGLIAAVPLELKELVRDWTPVRQTERTVKAWTRVDAAGDVLGAACAGMGADSARRAFAAAEKDGALDLVLSLGLAGATDGSLRLGAVAVVSEVVDAKTGERFTLTDGERRLRIATSPDVADQHEKQRLFQTYGAVMVDMESATVARMAQQREIPMCCIKAVSDDATAVLPNINPYVRNGQLRLLPFLVSVAVRPRFWRPLIGLARHSAGAAKSLAKGVDRFLLHKDWARLNRTGAIGE